MSRVPFRMTSAWLEHGLRSWLGHPLFYAGAALLMLGFRYAFDAIPVNGYPVLILLSYVTDALVVAVVWLALNRAEGRASLMAGWRALKGRRFKVMKSGLWGLPSAALAYLLLALAPPLLQAVSMAIGARAAGFLLLGWLFVCGWLNCLLLFGGLLAAIETARGEDRLWVAGMKGMRAVLLGWRPLLGVWTAFLCGAAICALAAAALLGHLPLDALGGPGRDLLETWIGWPALFAAVMAMLALLLPMSTVLLAAARREEQVGGLSVAAFGETAARRLSLALKALAAALLLSGAFVIDLNIATAGMGAVGLFLTSHSLTRAAPAWGQPDASLWRRWGWTVTTALPMLLVFVAVLVGST